ncbi:putative phosphatase [Janibacter sp. HTCC2649]|uniref:HAD-IA family hydrolase n=1 Tax=Janibacter sp. HTCC2649 TaxID=313589 RepID=UPI0000671A67|nr:HAD-IA family hydrolase [Janibacter sp. HTCC2649]EAP98259.1 putative phosphatase [Janibacter sp. HTCC2649]
MVAPLAGQFLERSFAGVLFDMDGTLIDSLAAVERSWLLWCEEFGIEPAALAGAHGRTSANTIAIVMAERTEAERLAAHARIGQIEVEDTEGIVVLPGAIEALEALDWLGVPHAIVTSCERDLAEARLAATGLPRPSVVVTASDVSHGKPGPEPYERGAAMLGVPVGDCVVVEDATAGLVSGRAAGAGLMVAVLGTTTVEILARDADVVVPSVADIPWQALVSSPS